jgi:hypothetical protein
MLLVARVGMFITLGTTCRDMFSATEKLMKDDWNTGICVRKAKGLF